MPTESASSSTRALLTVVLLAAVLAFVLVAMGRAPWCRCGELYLWHPHAWSSHTSQHLLDPYSFSHVQHGLLFYAAMALLKVPARRRLVIALLIEAAWEVLENTPLVIERYRTVTVSLDYFGDAIGNSIGDLMSCLAGFVLAARLRPWLSVLIYLAIEIGMLLAIRDSLTLNVLMLLYPLAAVREWQLVPQR